MTEQFDKDYWDQRWHVDAASSLAMASAAPNPYLATEVPHLHPATALDAGCGAGAEAIYLAQHGWTVTGVDIAGHALDLAAERAGASNVANRIQWVAADLSTWAPQTSFDLVMTHYAHPAMPQLDFYERIAEWVAPGGTLLIVGHLDHHHGHHQGEPPTSASVTVDDITKRFDPTMWIIANAESRRRQVPGRSDGVRELSDVVVRFIRNR